MRKTSYVKDLKIIRDLVESYVGVNISCRSRKREVVYGRAIYYQLARDFTPHPLALIGGEINKDHSRDINCIKLKCKKCGLNKKPKVSQFDFDK